MVIQSPYSQPSAIPHRRRLPASSAISLPIASSNVRFGKGNDSEIPDILPQKPKGIRNRLKAWWKSFKKWLNPLYVIKRLFAFKSKKETEKLLKELLKLTPQKQREILDAPALEKISYKPVQRITTGVAQASRFYGPDHPMMHDYRDYDSLNVLETYGVKWSPFKVVRDAFQNFYDGQGQTLDGVNTTVKKVGSGKHHIKINASATYDVDKLLNMGATGKLGAESAAGGFGEGAKIMAFVMLRDHGVDKVTFRSREWQAEFKLAHPGASYPANYPRVLMVKLSPLKPPIQGNNLEFETTDKELADAFKKGADKLFYNPKSEIFNNPLYENTIGGIKFLKGHESPGRVYEAGQLRAFERDGHYDAIPGLVLWSNKKLLDLKDRDRVAIQAHDVKDMMTKIIDGMSLDETAQGIQTLRKHWFYQKPEDLLNDKINRGDDKDAAEMMLDVLCRHYAELNAKNGNSTKKKPDFLPEGLVAVSPNSFMYGAEGKEQLKLLHQSGYLPVKPALEHLGVQNGTALVANRGLLLENKASKVANLSPREKRQIDVLSSSMKSLTAALRAQHDRSGSYWDTKVDDIAAISELPIEVVSLPEKDRRDSFMKVSQDEKRILVEKQILAKKSFPEAIQNLFDMAENKQYLGSKTTFPWLLNNPDQWSKLKQNWDKKD